jgi:uncharacterized phage protein (TIGR01671 family)
MRPLKFRFWNKLAHRFQTPNKYAIQGDGLYISYDYDMMAWDDPSSFDDSILVPCQYTGLKDKNNVEIYEGDILKGVKLFGLDGSYVGDVRYIPCRYQCFVKYPNDSYGGIILDSREILEHQLEVIGNIYENPDLLKQ